MRLFLAFRAFFRTLFSAPTAEQVKLALERSASGEKVSAATAATAAVPATQTATVPPAPRPARSEALNLLAALQREGRLIDFLQESLTGFSDAQIGAVAREIHRDCGKVVQRMFALRPAIEQAEGQPIELEAAFDAGRYRLVGNITGSAPFRGTVLHGGWEATHCEVPTWTGSEASQRVIAPAEVELK